MQRPTDATDVRRPPTPQSRGANLPSLGGFNQSVILDSIRRSEDGLSRVELSRSTGLSAQTITNIVRRLLDRGLVQEGPRLSHGPGKPRTLVQLDPTGALVMGIHLDPAILTLVVLDLTGAVLAHHREPTAAGADPERVIAGVVSAADALLTGLGLARDRLLGLGVAAPGPLDPATGVVLDPYHLPQWHQVPLRDELVAAMGVPVILDKDVVAAAVAERWVGGSERQGDFALVYFGTGLGAGLVVNGQVVRGASGNAGEVSHLVVDEDGPQCFCGLRGCLGVSCMPASLVAEGMAAGLLAPGTDLDDHGRVDVAVRALAALAVHDPGADAVLRRCARGLGRAAGHLANALDLELVVIGGPYWSLLGERYLPVVAHEVSSRQAVHGLHPVRVESSLAGDDVGAIGAATLVLDDAFSPVPSTLTLQA